MLGRRPSRRGLFASRSRELTSLACLGCFTHQQKDEVNLNLVLEYLPCTLHRAYSKYKTLKQTMPTLELKVSPSLPTLWT